MADVIKAKVVVIGSGPGGYSAAFRAAGRRVRRSPSPPRRRHIGRAPCVRPRSASR